MTGSGEQRGPFETVETAAPLDGSSVVARGARSAPEDMLSTERDPVTGRWLAGNKAALGAGGFGGRMREFREAFLGAITPEEFAQAARVLLGLALQGDTSAAALLLAYGLGRPLQSTRAGEDGGPLVVFEPLVLRGIDAERMRDPGEASDVGARK